MRRTRSTTLGLGALVFALSWSGLARSAPDDPAFDEGRKRMEHGDFAGACSQFKETYDREATAGKAFNLSACEEKQGHLTKAVSWMSDGIRRLNPNDDRLAGANDRRRQLEARLAKLTLVLSESPPPGTVVTLDGQTFEAGVRRPVDPGKHLVVAHVDGRKDASSEITLAEREAREITLELGPVLENVAKPTQAPGVARPAPSPLEPDGRRPRIVAGAVVGGLGVGSLIGFGVCAGLVAGAKSDFDAATTVREADDARHKGTRLEVAEGVLLGVGAAASVTGLVLILTAPKAHAPSSVSAMVSPRGVSLRGTFE